VLCKADCLVRLFLGLKLTKLNFSPAKYYFCAKERCDGSAALQLD